MRVRLLVLASAIGLAAVAPALIIDDFTDGDVNLVVNSGAGLASLDAATVLGGDRATWIGQSSFTGTRSSTLNVSGGSFSIDNSFGTSSTSSLGYGVNFVTNGGGFGVDSGANFDLSAFNTYRFHFEGNDQPLTVFIGLYMNNANAGVFLQKNVAGGQFSPFVLDVTMADMTGSFGTLDFTDVDQVRVDFVTSNAGDFAIDKFEAVPEPATIAAVGLGVASLLRRRRKS